MTDYADQIAAIRSSDQSLQATLDRAGFSDADVRAPSLLPGWTRAHVLTHVARNADGINRTVSGALRGEVVQRYPGDSRNRDIEQGALRPTAELTADVRDSAQRLDELFDTVGPADGWDLRTERDVPVHAWLRRRWREIEIHHVDIAGPYTPEQWPADFVAYLLPRMAAEVGTRTDQALHISVDEPGSLAPALVGSHWDVDGAGEPVEVHGPDWAVLAWLTGRASTAQAALSATPTLQPWL